MQAKSRRTRALLGERYAPLANLALSIATLGAVLWLSLPPCGAGVAHAGSEHAPAEPGPVELAAKERYPSVSGAIVLELQNDRAYHAEDRDAEGSDLYATVEPAIGIALTEQLSIRSALVFEPVEDPEPHESRELDRQGLFVEELYAAWELGPVALRAGKINPRFGKAWDLAPGLYGVDFAEDYELTERIGAGASYTLGSDALGEHALAFEAFFADTTHLSRSLVRGRSRVRRSDGGPSNTGRLGSYSLTLEGTAIPALPGLGYNLGLVYQEAASGERPESDYAVGLTYARPLSDAVDLELLVEYALQDNADRESDRVRRYLTTAVAATWESLLFALSYTLREENIRGERDRNDFLAQASVGYFRDLGPGEAGFEVGYKLTRETNAKIGTVGVRASWVIEF